MEKQQTSVQIQNSHELNTLFSCHWLKQSRFGWKHNATSQVTHMTGVFSWQSLHLRLPTLLSGTMCLGLWDPSGSDDSGGVGGAETGVERQDEKGATGRAKETGADSDLFSASISVSSKTSLSRNVFRVRAFCFFLSATSLCKMNAFSMAMSKRW